LADKSTSASLCVSKPNIFRNKSLLGITSLVALLLIVLFVWPTRYKSEPTLYFFQGDREMRSDRFSGTLQMKFSNGWTKVELQRLNEKLGRIKFDGNEFDSENVVIWMNENHKP